MTKWQKLLAQLKDKKPNGYVTFYGDSFFCSDEPPSGNLVKMFLDTGVIVKLVPLGEKHVALEDFIAEWTATLQPTDILGTYKSEDRK